MSKPAPSAVVPSVAHRAAGVLARAGALTLACALGPVVAQPAAEAGAALARRPGLPTGVLQPGEAARELGATAPNDTLWRIARRVQAPGLTPHQVMVALARRNPQAFVGGNMFWLRVGVPLVLPSRAELQAEPVGGAAELVATHQRAWQAGRAQAPDWAALPHPLAQPVLPVLPAPASSSAAAAQTGSAVASVPEVSLPVLPPPSSRAADANASGAPVSPAAGAMVDAASTSPEEVAPAAAVASAAATADQAPPIAAVLPPRGLDPAWMLAPFALLLAGGGLLWWWRLGRGDGFARTEPVSLPAGQAPGAQTAPTAGRPPGASGRPSAATARVVAVPTITAAPAAPGRPTTAAVWQAPAGSVAAPAAPRAEGEAELELLVAKAYLELGQPSAAREWLDGLAVHASPALREEAARLLRWHGA